MPKNKKTDKTGDYSFKHSAERLKERYNLEITQKEFDILNEQVRAFLLVNPKKGNEDAFGLLFDISKQKDATQYIIKIKDLNGIEVWCTFEDTRNTITTFLTPIKRKK